MPFTTYTYIADPVNVEYILKQNFPNYPKGDTYHSYMEVLLGEGIFNSDGDQWRKQRKTASYEFASKNLREYSTVIFRDCSLKLASMLGHPSSVNKAIDMQDLLMRMTLDSICKVGFGVEIGSLDPCLPETPFAKAFDAANEIVTLRFMNPFWRAMRFFNIGSEALLDKSIKVIDDFTYSVIRRRKAEKELAKHDILSRFIELSKDPDNNILDKTLRDIVLNFVIAGRDTTATTLSWAIYMLTQDEDVACKLYEELRAYEVNRAKDENVPLQDDESFEIKLSNFANFLTYQSLASLEYLHAVVTETLRLYPAVPQDPKGILRDDVLPDGTKVKKGGMVTYVPYSMGRMMYNWGSDAEKFRPERWFINGRFQHPSSYKFTAFQAGPRICLGKDSAYLQMKMALALLCRFYKFHLVPGHLVTYRMMAILSMKDGLKLTVSRRP